ncbi:uncharacterized protein BDZ83DRAFT_637775 [Colletotrichum acutatum]|uniref:Uncharacterized protein n=1 Tax=Glomerella acutata TaxID=27357 RepID=A0AAD8XCJ4_GLOAC|nr:uncharacterized protein BDZ83DRAFT_637775 [Colletotrichum acutatum]KAK1713307.1 hypothetical protein BDZ83DRAFT_637775 [Colletotrichum acutatum]
MKLERVSLQLPMCVSICKVRKRWKDGRTETKTKRNHPSGPELGNVPCENGELIQSPKQ